MLDKPTIINTHSKTQKTYETSLEFLSQEKDVHEKISAHLWAYHQMGNLIPETVGNSCSGHFFPFSESYYELEASYELALQGFYRYAIISLRSALELGLLSIYFAVTNKTIAEIKSWITVVKEARRRKEILSKLFKSRNFKRFNKQYDIQKRISLILDTLDNYIHTIGDDFSSSRLLGGAYFNQFDPKSFLRYCDFMYSVTKELITLALLKYPVGMQSLPIDEKYGLNAPICGLLRPADVSCIATIIPSDEKDFLKQLSDSDNEVKSTKKFFKDLPDLTKEEWERQSQLWEEFV